MNFVSMKYHVSERTKYSFIMALVVLSLSLLSMNMVVAQDRGYAKSSKIYSKRVKPQTVILSPRTQCKLLIRNKRKVSNSMVASRRKQPRTKRMAEGGSL